MKIFICGQKEFGAATFRALSEMGCEVVGVSSPPFASRGERRDRLRAAAEDAGVRWMPSGELNQWTIPEGVDLIVAAHSHDFIGRKTRLRARLGAIGYHPSLLPVHRGRDAIRWTIHMGDKVAGGSVYWLSETTDGGPIAAQCHVFVRPGDTPETLWRRDLFPLGVCLFKEVIGDLKKGRMVKIRQRQECGSWEPSFDRPPLFRPDLDLIGSALDGFTVVATESHAQEIGGYDGN